MEPQHICWRDYQPLFGKRDDAPPLPEERSERGLNLHAVIVIISAPKRGGGGGLYSFPQLRRHKADKQRAIKGLVLNVKTGYVSKYTTISKRN